MKSLTQHTVTLHRNYHIALSTRPWEAPSLKDPANAPVVLARDLGCNIL